MVECNTISGSGNDSIIVEYTENPNTTQRTGTITVTGGGITDTVTVTQSSQPFILTITPSERSVGYTSGSTDFTVESNTGWTISKDADWLSVNPVSGSGNNQITVEFTENLTTTVRIGEIDVRAGDILVTIILIQSAFPSQNPSKLTIQYGRNDEIIVAVDSSLTYSIFIPSHSIQLNTYKKYGRNQE